MSEENQNEVYDNNESILADIKKLLGISRDDTAFDQDIIIHINTVFMSLLQLGIGPDEGFCITGYNERWEDYNTVLSLLSIKTYIYLKVRVVFDPPQSSVNQSFENIIKEMEWRMEVQASETNEEE